MVRIRIQELMDERGLNLYQVAKGTEINYAVLYKYNTGKNKVIAMKNIEKICVFFGIEPGELFKISHIHKAKNKNTSTKEDA